MGQGRSGTIARRGCLLHRFDCGIAAVDGVCDDETEAADNKEALPSPRRTRQIDDTSGRQDWKFEECLARRKRFEPSVLTIVPIRAPCLLKWMPKGVPFASRAIRPIRTPMAVCV